jgi:hypothetical protein
MFQPGTILRLREPQSTDETPYPYDLVKVVGQSPIQHSRPDADSPFAGQDAVGYIITPAGDGFGPTLDKPYGELAELYDIEEYPTDPQTGEQLKPENYATGLSPEQILARAAREDAKNAAEKRKAAPSLQEDAKSPEQLFREKDNEAAKARRAAAKDKEKKDSDES